MNKILLVVVSLIIIAGAGVWAAQSGWFKQEEMNLEGKEVLFYGNTCPHCKEVKEWMEAEKITEKVEVVELEVYNNRGNQTRMVEAAKGCNIAVNQIAVPFLWTSGKQCLVGTPDIKEYLSRKAGLLPTATETLTVTPTEATSNAETE